MAFTSDADLKPRLHLTHYPCVGVHHLLRLDLFSPTAHRTQGNTYTYHLIVKAIKTDADEETHGARCEDGVRLPCPPWNFCVFSYQEAARQSTRGGFMTWV